MHPCNIAHHNHLQYYSSFVEVEKFDPRAELKKSKERIEEYIAKRAEFAFVSLASVNDHCHTFVFRRQKYPWKLAKSPTGEMKR